ncbi:MAG: hypothetical protein HOL85_11025 [Rhodospirillaceae bacterium]|jgi:hypothetical protein|nr:hypothetical protein [Rhodospirillaceae bacterium]MBT6136108.1 hypothetical protein [Rhodospirillaceae bacterium]
MNSTSDDSAAQGNGDNSTADLDPSTHFAFEHKIFLVDGARFVPSGQEREPALRVQVGELEASIPIDSLSLEFEIEDDSPDGKMLETVKKGLRYVKDIRPGDTIPRELLDGSASWSIEDKHRELAKNKLLIQVALWVSGRETTALDEAQVKRAMADKQTTDRIDQGLEELADQLGMGKDRVKEVRDLIDRVARELAYVEALRERFQHAHAIQTKLNQVHQMHGTDRQFTGEIQRVKALMEPPIKDFSLNFDQVDAQTGEIVNVLKTYDKQITFIREMRDELHQKLMIWEEIIQRWDMDLSHKSKAIREAVQATYRFVAYHFPQAQDWM